MLRWILAGVSVVVAIAIVFLVDPTTCKGDVCTASATIDLAIIVAGIIAAVLVLKVRRRAR